MSAHWSHSKLSEYEKCPHRLTLKKEHEQAPNEHMLRGLAVHSACEQYLINNGPMPDLLFFSEDLEQIKNMGAQSELKWGLTATWEPEPDWDNAWGKCILDAVIPPTPETPLRIIDFKTGKPSPISHMDQAQTYAVAGQSYFPNNSMTITEFWYLDSGKIAQHTFTPSALKRSRTILEARINRMLNDKEYRPKPNKFNCKWCNYKEFCEYSNA